MEAITNRIEFIPFLSGNLICIIVENEPYVILNPIIQAIGLEETTARKTINQRASFENKIVYVKFPPNYRAESALSFEKNGIESIISMQYRAVSALQIEDLGSYRYMALHLSKFPAWLNNIHLGKVKQEIRQTLLTYQNECDVVLYDHFFKKTFQYNSYVFTIAECKSLLPALKDAAYETKEMIAYTEMDNKRLMAEKALADLKKKDVSKQTEFQF